MKMSEIISWCDKQIAWLGKYVGAKTADRVKNAYECHVNMYKSIKELAERAEPKRPAAQTVQDKRFDVERCPVCGTDVRNSEYAHNFCPECGQAIDWTKAEEGKRIRYYLRMRPFAPGAYPKCNILDWFNYPQRVRTMVNGMSWDVWGWFDTDHCLDSTEIRQYDLIEDLDTGTL